MSYHLNIDISDKDRKLLNVGSIIIKYTNTYSFELDEEFNYVLNVLKLNGSFIGCISKIKNEYLITIKHNKNACILLCKKMNGKVVVLCCSYLGDLFNMIESFYIKDMIIAIIFDKQSNEFNLNMYAHINFNVYRPFGYEYKKTLKIFKGGRPNIISVFTKDDVININVRGFGIIQFYENLITFREINNHILMVPNYSDIWIKCQK